MTTTTTIYICSNIGFVLDLLKIYIVQFFHNLLIHQSSNPLLPSVEAPASGSPPFPVPFTVKIKHQIYFGDNLILNAIICIYICMYINNMHLNLLKYSRVRNAKFTKERLVRNKCKWLVDYILIPLCRHISAEENSTSHYHD